MIKRKPERIDDKSIKKEKNYNKDICCYNIKVSLYLEAREKNIVVAHIYDMKKIYQFLYMN